MTNDTRSGAAVPSRRDARRPLPAPAGAGGRRTALSDPALSNRALSDLPDRAPSDGALADRDPGEAHATGSRAAGSEGASARLSAQATGGMPGLAVLFLLSLLPQISFKIGPLLLKPYRIVLLVLFLPLLVRLLSGGAGRMRTFTCSPLWRLTPEHSAAARSVLW